MVHRTFYLCLILLILLLKVTEGLISCNITKNGDPTQFGISQITIDATQRENSTEGYQVLKNQSPTIKIDCETKFYLDF